MKVELQCGDKITIPEGCKAIVKDGCVLIEREQKFKDGDILVSVDSRKRYSAFIYKDTHDDGFHSYYIGLDTCGQLSISESLSDRWCGGELSYATEEEKQILFDKMKEQGLKWNAEEKKVEEIRWRAECGEKYFILNMDGRIYSYEEYNNACNDVHYNAFNYFRTEEQDKEAARRVKETLRKFHEEIGE